MPNTTDMKTETTEIVFTFETTFHLNPDPPCLTSLHAKAAQIDDAHLGEHLAEYTNSQALVVVWHDSPEWLVEEGILVGWTADRPNLWSTVSEYVPAAD